MRKFLLKQNLVGAYGNVYFARAEPYLENELPARYLDNKEYLEEVFEDKEVEYKFIEQGIATENVTQSLSHLTNPHLFEKLEIKPQIRTSTIIDKKKINEGSELEVISTVVNELKDEEKTVHINTATYDELRTISGVGDVIAKKVIAARKEKEFNSVEELDQLVPLKFSKKWSEISKVEL